MRKFSYEYEPAQIMKAVIKDNGKNIFLSINKQKLSGVIFTSYAKHKELRDILLKAVEFGIPAELLKLYNKGDREQSVRAIVRRFAEENNFLPKSESINKAISCFTFALDYGMFNYNVYPPYSKDLKNTRESPLDSRVRIPAVKKQFQQEDKKPVFEKTEKKTVRKKNKDNDGGFVDFKTWYEKKQVAESQLKKRDTGKLYIHGDDNKYYELEQTNHLTEPGTNFPAVFENFGLKKKEREIIKMGIDICSELEVTADYAELKPDNIFRDKFGNYKLNRDIKNDGNIQKNHTHDLGLFMRELLDINNPKKRISGKLLNDIARKACENGYRNISDMKKELEYAFELSLDIFTRGGPSMLTDIKARADELTNEDITDMSIPDRYMSVGARAFIRRENLISLKIPDSIESIYGFAFAWCNNLAEVTIEHSANLSKSGNINIGNFAFWGCESLRKVTMRGFIKNIGDCVFYGSRNLKVDIHGDITGDANLLLDRAFYGSRDLEVNIYTGGKRKEKKHDRIYNNRIQFY